MPRCEALTQQMKECPNRTEMRTADGRWLCHLHHPDQPFQLQLKARKEARAKIQKLPKHSTINVTRSRNVKRTPKHPEYRKMLRALRRELGLAEPA